jgi:DNA (cytosine-5)-methyltransferase 1
MQKKEGRAQQEMKFAVVDLFAGPGGLAEGFSAASDATGGSPFEIALSVEKDPAAYSTLLLRSFLRQFGRSFPHEYYRFLQNGGPEPEWGKLYPDQWESAKCEAVLLEIGPIKNQLILRDKVLAIRQAHGDRTILIGGPPCQAYSLIGRARNKGIADYVPEKDKRHTLYKKYIEILALFRPAAFVMENVRGILSSSLNEKLIFDLIRSDLEAAGYRLLALNPPKGKTADLFGSVLEPQDFLLCAEDFGVPQARHRVIVAGIRVDLADRLRTPISHPLLAAKWEKATVRHVLGGMPKLRSGLSRNDSPEAWLQAVEQAGLAASKAVAIWPSTERRVFRDRIAECSIHGEGSRKIWPRSASRPARLGPKCPPALAGWLLDPKLDVLPNNESRCHMPSDLARYLFAAVYGELIEVSPKARDFPETLYPNHQSWTTGSFADRFRVQLWGEPSTTVTSHISKDGHYFIHPDPEQCRSLTVREAARLQTFPDNYLFRGNRTQQFIQVGNAVPPFLAKQIAEALYRLVSQCFQTHGCAAGSVTTRDSEPEGVTRASI